MIAPLLRLAPPSGVSAAAPPLVIGAGQTVGLAGPFRQFWRDAAFSALTAARIHHPGTEAPGAPPDERMLTLVEFPESPRRREIAEWLGVLEPALQAGGAALFLAPRFPDSLPLTRIHSPAPGGALRDDADQPAEFLRCGEWGALVFKPPGIGRPGALRLRLAGAEGDWASPWWPVPRALAALDARQWRAEFAVPCPAGEYRAVLECERGSQSTAVRMQVKGAHCFPPPHRFDVRWRMVAEPGPNPSGAARLWRNPESIARQSLPLSLGALDGAAGWEPLERSSEAWRERRWIGAHAAFMLSAAPGTLRLKFEDHRPRGPGAPPTRVTVRLDGRIALRETLQAAGEHALACDWPGDDLPHEVSIDTHPTWSPGEFGGEDARRLGLLIYSAGVES